MNIENKHPVPNALQNNQIPSRVYSNHVIHSNQQKHELIISIASSETFPPLQIIKNSHKFFYGISKSQELSNLSNFIRKNYIIISVLDYLKSQMYSEKQIKLRIQTENKIYLSLFNPKKAIEEFQMLNQNFNKENFNTWNRLTSQNHQGSNIKNSCLKNNFIQVKKQKMEGSKLDNQLVEQKETLNPFYDINSQIETQSIARKPPIFSTFSTQNAAVTYSSSQLSLVQLSQNPIRSIQIQNYRVGLCNLGNTCYINASIQALIHTPQLFSYFLKNDKLRQKINYTNQMSSKGQVTLAFTEMIKQIPKYNEKYLKPYQFKKRIGRFSPQFMGFEQQDSSGLILTTLNAIHEDLNQNFGKKIKYRKKFQIDYPLQKASQQFWTGFCKKNQSIISKLFYGQQVTYTKCHNPECNAQFNTFSMFLAHIIPISIPNRQQNTKKLKFYAIKHHTEIEEKQVQYNADKCKTFKDLCNKIEKQYFPEQIGEFIYFWVHKKYDFEIIRQFEKTLTIEQLAKKLQTRRLFIRKLQEYQENPKLTRIIIYHTLQQKPISILPYPSIYYLNSKQNVSDIYKQIYQYFHPNQKVDTYQQHHMKLYRKQNYTWKLIVNKEDNLLPILHNQQIFLVIWNQQSNIFTQSKLQMQHDQFMISQLQQKQTIKLEDCLLSYQTQLNIGNELYCSKCDKDYACDMIRYIYKAPKILIIQFKRFEINQIDHKKDSRFVKFLHELDLSKVRKQISKFGQYRDMDQAQNSIYQLYGIVNHVGSLKSGHYYAYCKDLIGNDWYEYDDSRVRPIKTQDVCTDAAYILFYRKQQ